MLTVSGTWTRRSLATITLIAGAICATGCGGGGSTGGDTGGGPGGGTGGGGLPGSTSNDATLESAGVQPPPPLSIVPERPLSGKDVRVRVAAPGATGIDLTLAGRGCGTLSARTGAATPLEVTGIAGADGYCDLTAVAHLAGGTTSTWMARFEVQSTAPDLPPISADAGVYELGEFPVASSGPTVTAVDGPPGFINGATATYTVRSTGAQEVRAALVKVSGYDGYFHVPVTPSGGLVSFDLRFAADFFTRTAGLQRSQILAAAASGPVDVLVALEDALGRVGAAFTVPLTPRQVQTGEVKVSIAWDTPTDVDLHVTEPGGTRVYYGNTTSPSGGRLDLDSNAGCTIDGVNNENIYWPVGQAPNGAYTVRVHMYASPCSENGPAGASGTLSITYCGNDSPRMIPFSLASDGSSYETTFTSTCSSRVVGTVRYEDFPITDTAFGPGELVPSRFVTVQVIRAKDDVVLAEGNTDAAGRYDLSFANDKEPGFYVNVLAKRDSTGIKQSVQDLSGTLYAFRKPKKTETAIDETQPTAPGQPFLVDVDVRKADGAGALNIFEVGLASALYTYGKSGRSPPALIIKWEAGRSPPLGNTSYYQSGVGIFVNGDAQKPREYNDVVIAHEYGHFVLDTYSTDDSPGGDHGPWTRDGPPLAWSEGWATFFAAASQRRSSYIAINSSGPGVSFSIETLPPGVPTGNAGSVLSGNVSEAVVSAVLYDLFDATNEDKDDLSGKNAAIWTVLTSYLKAGNAKFTERGAAGRDLVDFLDGWSCLGFGDRGADDAHGLRGVVKGLAGLSYDFTELASCK